MTSFLSLEDQILVALRRITRAIDLHSRVLLQDFGLTAPQLTTLSAIRRLQPVTAGRIAREVHLGQPTVTGVLNRLEKRGLIERVRGDHDRRSVNVSLTPDGERVLDHAPSLLQDQFQAELANLQEWERTQMLATLQRIADMMHVSRLDAAPVLTSEFADSTLADSALAGPMLCMDETDETEVLSHPK
jgi:DNA-binding MarR family transcriptional regulator